ncbi:type II toxin-antitoxin system RelE/ParE family toxin [Chryseobacterium sp. SN22]|uniref:type II toxin-antitoxin system RelE/ParE family toxin n=1 Tax=Chryseobacterium sp. SN22 TaxID=2606431 RepID=UPI0011ECBD24|nr:type II toxin-antitoxin system RelE/ParE family toxin [Chryseobacterium sp. SN22]KAA0128275.1 type II toxin-antitoxin system RelE/ParE family toxin [Chryseobacterium sp. SN22]
MKIKFSDESLSDLLNIEEYLLRNWNDRVLEDFLIRLDEKVQIICNGKVVFQKYEDSDYHKILITKHNTLVYSVEDEVLKIIRIIQNYQDPEENYKSLQP